jgi:hypothetical protein
MMERTQSFDMDDYNQEEIQKITENILRNNLTLSFKTCKVGDKIIRINYFDEEIDENLQRDNKITILQEPERKYYINVKGKLTDDQISELWGELNLKLKESKGLKNIGKNELTKDDIINEICNSVKGIGFHIDVTDALGFVENFMEKFYRLPKRDEIESIVKGFVLSNDTNKVLKETVPEEVPQEVKPIQPEELTTDFSSMNIITILKPTGRRVCPRCGPGNWFKIHEIEDKDNLVSVYPKIYGKKYSCDNCRSIWKYI